MQKRTDVSIPARAVGEIWVSGFRWNFSAGAKNAALRHFEPGDRDAQLRVE
jgi:hypothetical protein